MEKEKETEKENGNGVENGGPDKLFSELFEELGQLNSNFPPKPLTGEEGSGEEGKREEPAPAPQAESVEDNGAVQAEGGATSETPKTNSKDSTLPNAQAKRPLSELSSESPVVSEKRGRAGSSSDSSSVEDLRVFPSDSPNEVSFLNIALQSTPRRAVNIMHGLPVGRPVKPVRELELSSVTLPP
ncbi:hypothetical protein L3Q82_014583 [Xyrichtys novacula]|uniref:Uncharacterized protein n=1 Tax=Xyrichtys novacula TaxID=13765 RepID=A0AAV1F9V4_XYRNO|nr:hypothetical protein L3Q82_014583 [Xyrichtys novacula]